MTSKINGTNVQKTITVAALIAELTAQFPERSEAVRAIVAAVIAGEHAVILGPPGTAKSLLVRTIAAACGLTSWEVLMTKTTVPDEIIGPLKLSGLQNDRFTRAMGGYLPTAEIAFLDEVFKANSAILNALLTILNERIVHDDGQPKAVPLVSCIGASNELPDGPELGALYDRFLVRLNVDYITDPHAFSVVLRMGTPKVSGVLDIAAEKLAFDAVKVSSQTLSALVDLRTACRKEGVIVSDRRWRQCLSLVRAYAHLDGRSETDPEDLECLENVLWSKPDEKHAIVKLVASVISPHGAKATEELDMAREIVRRLPPVKGTDPGAYLGSIGTAMKDLKEIAKRVKSLPTGGKRVALAATEIQGMQIEVSKLAAIATGIEL